MSKKLGGLVTRLFEVKKQKADHNVAVKLLNKEIETLEKDLLAEMRDADLLTVSNDLGKVYIAGQIVPNVVNWDTFYEYVGKTNSFHLLERRLTRTAYREMIENGDQVPGVDPVSFDEVRTRKE